MGSSGLIYRDDVLLVAEKPAELLCVPGKGPDKADCLYSRLLQEFPDLLVVHRLDQSTSGLMVWALTKEAQRALGRQFEAREVSKTYEALISGRPQTKQGEIRLKQRLDVDNRPLQIVDPVQGKEGITNWRILEHLPDGISRIHLEPHTGRTHQLRLHMACMGTPIVGDRLYGDGDISRYGRMCLHACMLSIRHPESGIQMEFVSPVPF